MINVFQENHNKSPLYFDRKEFLNIRHLIVDKLFERTVMFFSININFPFFWNNPNFFSIDSNLSLKEKKILTIQHSYEYIYNIINKLNDEFLNMELSEFAYLVVEKHLKDPESPNYGFPHIHILFSMRSLIGYNKGILIGLKEIFYKYSSDCYITYLNQPVQIYKYWNYVIKNTKDNKNDFKNHFFYIYNYNSSIYGKFFDFIHPNNQNLPFAMCSSISHKHSSLKSINMKLQSEFLLIHLWSLFFQLDNIFFFDNKIYQKNYDSKYSYTLIGDVSILKNYGNIIMENLKKHFPLQMEYVNIYSLIVTYFDRAIKAVSNLTYLLPLISINQHLIEFTDGVYNSVYDVFLAYNNEKHQLLFNDITFTTNLNCGRFYKFTFHHITKPYYWLSKISQQLNYVEKDIEEFCTYFGRLFHTNPLFFDFPKQSTLVLHGPSNTGKTSLVVNTAKDIIGLPNVGFISKSDTFGFQNIINKELIVIEEFQSVRKMRDYFLKLMSGESLLIDVKNKDPFLLSSEKKVPVIMSFNPDTNFNFLNDPAVQNRIKLIKFNHIINDNEIDSEFDSKLKLEYHKILVYCNRLFVKKHLRNKFRLRSLNNHNLPLFKSIFLFPFQENKKKK